MDKIIKAILLCVIISTAGGVCAYDGDVEIVIDDRFGNVSNDEMTISIDDFKKFSDRDWKRRRVAKNLEKYMLHYHNPDDDELSIRIMFSGESVTVGLRYSYFYPTSEERIDMLEYLISENRIVPHVVMSRCYTSDLVSALCPDGENPPDGLVINQKPKYVIRHHEYHSNACKWLFSKCAQSVHPLPDSPYDEHWYNLLFEMRCRCFRTCSVVERKKVSEIYGKILHSDDIAEEEKMKMVRLHDQEILSYSMAILLW